MVNNVQGRHLFVRDFFTRDIFLSDMVSGNHQAGLRFRFSNVMSSKCKGSQRTTSPGLADFTEQPMFDGIPFGGARRIVTHCHHQIKAICDLILQMIFPGSGYRTVTAAAIGLDQQASRVWKTQQSFGGTPGGNIIDCKSRDICGTSEVDRAMIELEIVNPIRDGRAQCILLEIMHVDPFGGLTPNSSRVPKVANQLLFLRIRTDMRFSCLLMLPALFLNMLKLFITFRILLGTDLLSVDTQTVMMRFQ